MTDLTLNVGLDGLAWYGREAVAIALFESEVRSTGWQYQSWSDMSGPDKNYYRRLAQYKRKPSGDAEV